MHSKHVGEACEGEEHRWAHPRTPGDACRCGRKRLCAQCYRGKPLAMFRRTRPRKAGATPWLKNCSECRTTYAQPYGERASEPRRSLRMYAPAPSIIWSARSGNAKLGRIGAATVSAETCPPSCGFYGRGCFAEYGVQGYHWRRAQDSGLSWKAFLDAVRAVPEGEIWRYAVAGDLPGNGEELDAARLREMVRANFGRRGFTFTHKSLASPVVRLEIAVANADGFTINLSADTLAQADEKDALGIDPVAVVLPLDAPRRLRTPGGLHVISCPFETNGLTCDRCQLCAIPTRKAIVGFRAHGQMQKTVSKIAKGAAA